MKGFIIKTIGFSGVAIVVLLTIMLGANYIIKANASFKVDKDKTTLVLGHSHSECSVNDALLKNSINLSASGESYFFNYQKLKQVAKANPQINTVFLEFANNHVDSIMDDWIWGHQKMSFYLQYYSPFIESEDLNLLFENNSTDLVASYSLATRKHLFRILRNDYNLTDEIGRYSNSEMSKVDEMIAKNEFNPTISEDMSLSETNLAYLRKIIAYCNANDINIFLFRSPQHPLYADLRNEAVYQNVLKTRFKDIDMLDFDAMTFPNHDYLDLHHLNANGSRQFTTLFNTLIKNGLLKAANKQSIIDEKIKIFNANQVQPSF